MMMSWTVYKLDPTPTTMLVSPRPRRSRRLGSTRRGR